MLPRVAIIAFSFVGLVSQTPSAVSQAAPSSPSQAETSALPNDPKALLQLALNENGLHGSSLQPWHVHASWKTLQDQSTPGDEGTWEEWWAGSEKYKIAYKSATADRTFYGTERGHYVLSSSNKTQWQFMQAERLIQQPIGAVQFAAPMETSLRFEEMQQGGVPMHCVIQTAMSKGNPIMMLNHRDGKSHPAEFGYCFVGDLPALRSAWVSDGGRTVFNSVVRFQGQFLARKIRFEGAGGTETDITVDMVEPMEKIIDADFTPPSGALLVPDKKPGAESGKTN